eukprot:1195899-Prorocentrum_minimum.AAC.3
MLSARVSSCECYNSTACPFNAHTAPTSLAPRTLFVLRALILAGLDHRDRAAPPAAGRSHHAAGQRTGCVGSVLRLNPR